MNVPVVDLEHPAWLTGFATLVGYGAILAVMFVVLFVVPFLLW